MNSLLRDLYGHQAWADAELWRALEAHPSALEDKTIRDRLHHMHAVQRAFLWIVGDRATAYEFTKPEDFRNAAALKEYGRTYHEQAVRYVSTVTDARLAESIDVPWFQNPSLDLTVERALTQAAMHSQHHRAQNATRLRELGGKPPTIDLIVWYWRGLPAPVW